MGCHLPGLPKADPTNFLLWAGIMAAQDGGYLWGTEARTCGHSTSQSHPSAPQSTIKAHCSKPLEPLHKPDPPLFPFLGICRGLLSCMKKQEIFIAFRTDLCRTAVPSPNSFEMGRGISRTVFLSICPSVEHQALCLGPGSKKGTRIVQSSDVGVPYGEIENINSRGAWVA